MIDHTSNPSVPFARPRTRIFETANAYLAEVELPGVNKDRLDLTFNNGEVTVIGRRQPITEAQSLHGESLKADFRRVFELGAGIDASGITATMDQGLLSLQLPKAEAARSRRIEVSGAERKELAAQPSE